MGDPGSDRTLTADGAGVAASGGASFATGAHVGARYEIVRFIAAGGMGEVYEAEDKVLGTRVALKAVRAAHAGSAPAVDRLKREIALARKVTHPNVCRVHDVGEHAGRAFLTMELLGGETLADRLKGGALDDAEVARIAPQLVAALGALHAAGIVHRDFKSSNIVLDGERVVVTDFGLARSTETGGDARLTADASLLGTPAYMAPEQVEGREATAASDIYALGVVLYEMTTGALPFAEDTPLATATARLTRDPPVPETSARWQGAILRCLERAPQDRPRRVEDVLGARRRRRSGVAFAAVGLVVVGVGAAVAISGGGDRDDAGASDCASGERRLEGIWDPATRARIAARFAASDQEHVAGTWRAISGQLDEHSASWARLWDAACTSTDRTDDPLLHAQRLTCADHHLLELRAHSSMLADPAVDIEEVSLGFMGRFLLSPISDCEQVALLRAQAPVPAAADRAAIDELMLAYHRARVRIRRAVWAGLTDGLDDGFAEVRRIGSALKERGYSAGYGELAFFLGRYLTNVGRYDEAAQDLDAAIAFTEEARDDVMLIWVLAGRVYTAAVGERAYDAERYGTMIARAEAMLGRIGDPASVRVPLAEAKAHHAMRLRRYADVLAGWDEARLAMEQSGRVGDGLGIRQNMVNLRTSFGEAAASVAEMRAVVREQEQEVGPWHIWVAHRRTSLAFALFQAGDAAAALDEIERVIAIMKRALGEAPSSQVADSHRRAFYYARALGDEESAERHLRAYASIEVARGSSESTAYGRLAETAMADGHRQAAEEGARAAIATSKTAADRAKGYEELADLILESGESFGHADWEERLAGLPEVNYHATLAVIDARGGDEDGAMHHLEALAGSPFAGAVAATHGVVLLEGDRPAEASEHFARAVEKARAGLPWDDVLLAEVTARLGIALLRAGDAAGAIEPLEDARWILGLCCGGRSVLAQETGFALAQALWDTGGDRARAKHLATEAHAALAAMGPSLDKKARAVAAWLERH